jgi:hypothetical protein
VQGLRDEWVTGYNWPQMALLKAAVVGPVQTFDQTDAELLQENATGCVVSYKLASLFQVRRRFVQ